MALKLLRPSEPSEPAIPNYSALLAHHEEVTAIQNQDTAWATKETAELEHVRVCGAEKAALTALEKRRVDAQADSEVLGRCDEDLVALGHQIEAARTRVATLIERATLAQAKVLRIRDQRMALREQVNALNTRLRPLQHAARTERLGAAMEGLLEAEAAYVRALVAAFGVATTIDELARAPGTRLDFAGGLALGELILPRPFHLAFKDRPSPMRPDIGAAIAAEAARVEKELS
jgi:hypothetical protein